MTTSEADLPHVSLNRTQWIRLAIVGLFVVFALARVVPDLVRTIYPLNIFDYATDGDGVVISRLTNEAQALPTAPAQAPAAAPSATPKPTRSGRSKPVAAASKTAPKTDTLALGDRIVIGRIKPFDRKPGLAGVAFTYDNPDRTIPVERAHHIRDFHLQGRPESGASRFFAILRIALFALSVGLGAILFLIKPGIATGAFFVFCLGGDAPTTYLDLVTPNPWRQIPEWLGNMLHGAARPALFLFALCLIDGDTDAPRERIFAMIAGVLAAILGTINAYGAWLLTYAARPAERVDRFTIDASDAVTALTAITFVVAFMRARGVERQRIVWIVAAFLFAAAARLASDALFPRLIPSWLNGILLSTTIVPIAGVWIAVIRQRFFNVDFVVSRAIVYVALTAAAFGTITVVEELGTYLFYNNTDFAYGLLFYFRSASVPRPAK